MKVIFITALTPTKRNGESIYVARIIKALINLHHEVEILALVLDRDGMDYNNWINELKFNKVSYSIFSLNNKNILSALKKILKILQSCIIKAKNANVICYRLFFFQPVALLVKLVNKKVLTVWFHDGIVEEINFAHNDFKHCLIVRIAKFMEKIFSKWVDWYFPVSYQMKEYADKSGIKAKNYKILPCVVETELFKPNNELSLSSKKEDMVIGYAGSLAPWQGFHEGCEYIKFLNDNGYNIRFVVLTNEINKAKHILETEGLHAQILSVGHNEVPEIMSSWHFALVPKIGGLLIKVSSPLKVAEALSMGIPLLISSNVGDYSSMISSSQLGVIFDPLNKSMWPDTLTTFNYIIDNYERVKMNARELAISDLSMEKMIKVLRILDYKM